MLGRDQITQSEHYIGFMLILYIFILYSKLPYTKLYPSLQCNFFFVYSVQYFRLQFTVYKFTVHD